MQTMKVDKASNKKKWLGFNVEWMNAMNIFSMQRLEQLYDMSSATFLNNFRKKFKKGEATQYSFYVATRAKTNLKSELIL